MNYLKNYYDYINYIKSTNRTLDYYQERHHILPRCIGGTDVPENLIYLTAREHFLAHYLLTKIYNNEPKIIDAFRMMAIKNDSQERYINSRLYEKLKKYFSEARSKKVVCIETGEIYPSAIYVEKNICNGIRDVIHGRQLTAGGYHWRYLNEEPVVKKPHERKKVICANNMKIYNSIKEAAEEIGVSESCIKSVCNNSAGHNTAKGLTFYYYEQNIKEYKIKTPNSKEAFKKKVICVETGKVYNSITDAAIDLYKNKNSAYYIGQCCKGKKEKYKNLHWKYKEKK